MKIQFLLLILVANIAVAWEASECVGTQEARTKSLIDLGEFSNNYKKTHVKVPNLMYEYDAEFWKGVPADLKGYLLDISVENIAYEKSYVSYICRLKQQGGSSGGSEQCQYLLKSKKLNCFNWSEPPDFEVH